jgi:hypothetical protein
MKLDGGRIEIDVDVIQKVKCEECGKEWTDVYKLDGYDMRDDAGRLISPCK